MKEELIELGKKLKELAEKYNQDYLTISCYDGDVMGWNSPEIEEAHISFFIEGEEDEK